MFSSGTGIGRDSAILLRNAFPWGARVCAAVPERGGGAGLQLRMSLTALPHAAILALLIPAGASLASPQALPPGCAEALDALEAAREARSAAADIERLRQRASKACLGAPAQAPPLVRPVPPAVQVAPVAPALPPVPPSVLPRAPVPIERPSIITNCDAGGCWDAEGRRLNRLGQELIGPRGPCTAQGTLFVCP